MIRFSSDSLHVAAFGFPDDISVSVVELVTASLLDHHHPQLATQNKILVTAILVVP
jgi:hypothetical protein